MIIELTGRNYEIGEHLKSVIEQKLSKLDKYFSDEEVVARVCLKKQAKFLTTEIMLNYAGKFVRASVSSDNFYDNIDIILPKLEGQIRKFRTRFDKHNKNNAYKDIALFEAEKNYENQRDTIVKEKKFKLSPMTVNEAIEEMELLGHSFYVFLEAKTNTVQIIYKRNDGDLGLIEPEV